jgi:hypothetical protein
MFFWVHINDKTKIKQFLIPYLFSFLINTHSKLVFNINYQYYVKNLKNN